MPVFVFYRGSGQIKNKFNSGVPLPVIPPDCIYTVIAEGSPCCYPGRMFKAKVAGWDITIWRMITMGNRHGGNNLLSSKIKAVVQEPVEIKMIAQ